MSRSDEPTGPEITAGVQRLKLKEMPIVDLAKGLHSLRTDCFRSGNNQKDQVLYNLKSMLLEEAINRLLPDAIPPQDWTDEEWLWSMHSQPPDMHVAIIGTIIAKRRQDNVA